MKHQHLAIAIGARADSDGGNSQAASDNGGEFARDSFQDDGESSRFLQSLGIRQKFVGGIEGSALHSVAPQGVNGLRRQADMPHHGDLRFHEFSDQPGAFPSAFKFYCLRAAFLEEADRAGQRLFIADMIGAVRQIDNQQGPANAPANGF